MTALFSRKVFDKHRLDAPLVLGILLVIHAAVTLLWLDADTWVIHRVMDAHHHYANIATISTNIALGYLGFAAERVLTGESGFYSSLGLLPSIVSSAVFGASPFAMRAANLAYFAMLLVATYRIGVWCHGRRAGLLAAVLVSLMPAAYGGVRAIGNDFPALCATALAFSALQRCRGFGDRRAAALFGLAAGFAILCKATAAFFLVAPAMMTLARGLQEAWKSDDRQRVRRPVTGAVVALLALLVTSAPWWWGRIALITTRLASHTTGEGMLHYEYDTSLWGGVEYYLSTLPLLIGGPSVLLLLALAPRFFRRSRGRWEVLLWIIVPIVLHIVLKVRNFRYLFPLVPAVAVVISVGLCSLSRRRLLHAGAVALSVCAAFVLWIYCSTSLVPVREFGHLPVSLKRYPTCCGSHTYAGPPDPATAEGSTTRAAQKIARWIHARHPGGRRVGLVYAGHSTKVGIMEQVNRLLPELRLAFFSERQSGGYLARSKGRHMYALVLSGQRPTQGFEREVFRVHFEDVDTGPGLLSCSLWEHGQKPPAGSR